MSVLSVREQAQKSEHIEMGGLRVTPNNSDTLPESSEVVKSFTPECGGKTLRGVAPRGFPDRARARSNVITITATKRPPLGVVDHYGEQ